MHKRHRADQLVPEDGNSKVAAESIVFHALLGADFCIKRVLCQIDTACRVNFAKFLN